MTSRRNAMLKAAELRSPGSWPEYAVAHKARPDLVHRGPMPLLKAREFVARGDRFVVVRREVTAWQPVEDGD